MAKGRLQFTNEPPLARALQLDQKWDSFAAARSSLSKCNAQGSDQDAGGFHCGSSSDPVSARFPPVYKEQVI